MKQVTEEDACKIIELYKDGVKNQDIAEIFGIHVDHANRIIYGRSFKHLNRDYKLKREIRQEYLDGLPDFTEEQQSYLVGSMLGDGSCEHRYSDNCISHGVFSKMQAIANIEYLEWSNKILEPYTNGHIGLSKTYGILHEGGKIVGCDTTKVLLQCRIRTISHEKFKNLTLKWYKLDENGNFVKNKLGHKIKIVPQDIQLTPLAIAIWACDDGCNSPKSKTFYFSTDSFTFDECILLSNLLSEFNINSKVGLNSNQKPQIYIRQNKSYRKIIELIEPYIIWDCLKYKCNLEGYVEPLYTEHPGVCLQPSGKWRATIQYKFQRKYLGDFVNKEDALDVRKKAEIDLFVNKINIFV